MRSIVTGSNGFIGNAIWNRLDGHKSTFDVIEYGGNFDYFFHFGSPSSQILFNANKSRCIQETIGVFTGICDYCYDKHIKLIYPSSGTIYTDQNSYAKTKKALEEIAGAYGFPSLGLRIFAGYGPGESHKKDYASVVYQFTKSVLEGRTVYIYGDGFQSRDFVFIDDIVDTIMGNLETDGIIDVGTGINTSFNDLINIIQDVTGKIADVEYIKAPKNYIEETVCKQPLKKFTPLREGIKRIVDEIKKD